MRRTLLIVALLDLPAAPLWAAELSRSELPARGQEEVLLTVDDFGRYAISAQSPQGVSLQLVDRMAGPGHVSGAPGASDGRLDVFLERGEYKVLVRGDDAGSGVALLQAQDFQEQSGPEIARLVPLKPVETALSDLQQRSWWIELDAREVVQIEAAGRALSDLRIWRDGAWLVEAKIESETIEPRTGSPLYARRLVADLGPGLYLLTAYGGPEAPWASGEPGSPLHLRYGIPELPGSDRRHREISAFGVDRFRVPGAAESFRIEAPDPAPVSLAVTTWGASYPFLRGGSRAQITDESVPPVATLQLSDTGDRLVTISGAAGQPYTLQHLDAIGAREEITGDGEHWWLATTHGASALDEMDATAVLVREDPEGARVVADGAIPLDRSQGYARRFNLLGAGTMLLHVKEGGDYRVTSEEITALHRIEPLFTGGAPRDYEAPPWAYGEQEWELEAGYYVLSLKPADRQRGVARVEIAPTTLTGSLLGAVGVDVGGDETPARASTIWGPILLERGVRYRLIRGEQPGVRVGLVQRRSPLDLSDAMPLSQRPGELVEIPARLSGPGVLRAVTDKGHALEVSVDGGAWSQAPRADAGNHRIRVKHPGGPSLTYALWFEADGMRPGAPLPLPSEAARAATPELPEIRAGAPASLDLERGESETWKLRVDTPGLYRVESAGLLSTQGHLRTRTITSFAGDAGGGAGRNFLVQSYLREGDYQLTVQTRGQTRGHLQVLLEQAPMKDGGALTDGAPARVALEASEGIVYTFEVSEPGDYWIHSIAQGRTSRCRLEDADGWPLIPPGSPADLVQRLEPGGYRLVILPDEAPSRRLTSVSRVAAAEAPSGHGPHPAPLNRWVEHTWREPAEGDPRAPDLWTFDLPAAVDVRISASEEMSGVLTVLGGDEDVARLSPGRDWSGPLPAGSYQLELSNARRNNGAPYRFQIYTRQLLAGTERSVQAPTTLEIASDGGLTEIRSEGSFDLRARLYDPDGALVAEADDRPGDWNFQIVERLSAGIWRLELEPVGASRADGLIRVEDPAEIAGAALSEPGSYAFEPGRAVHLLPLQIDAPLVTIRTRSEESVSCAIESWVDGGWQTLAEAAGPETLQALRPGPGSRYRLRLRSLDQRGGSVALEIGGLEPAPLGEAALARGARLPAARDATSAAAEIALDGPGLFAFEAADGLYGCRAEGGVCARVEPDAPLAAAGDRLVLVQDLSRGDGPVTASRIQLAPGVRQRAPLYGAPSAAAGPGAIVDVGEWSGRSVVIARGVAVQPGIRPLASAAGRRGDAAEAGAWSVSEDAAIAVLDEASRVQLWSAAPGGGDAVGEAALTLRRFPAAGAADVGWGAWSEGLGIGLSRSFALPRGEKALRLTLGAGAAAMLIDGDGRRVVRWADGQALDVAEGGDWRQLVVLNVSDRDTYFAAELLPSEGEAPALSWTRPFEVERQTRGRIYLTLPPAAEHQRGTLQVRGAVRAATWVGADGRVAALGPEGVDPGRLGGELVIDCDPGAVLAWLTQPGDEAEALWGDAEAPKARAVALPARTQLSGDVARLAFNAPGPGLVSLRAPGSLVAMIRRGEAAPEVMTLDGDGAAVIWVPGGEAEILLRGLAGAPLRGEASLTFEAPTPIGEGLGPRALIPPGGARAFTFEVSEPGAVGLGVRADADVIGLTLLDAAGRRIEAGGADGGAAMMPALTPGVWTLILQAPASSRPVVARPAVAGIERPDTGPPDEVVQTYLLAAGIEPEEGSE